MMEAKIIKQNTFTDKEGKAYRNFKLKYEWDFFWFSEKTFESYPGLFEIKDESIWFKEPIDSFFILEKKQNKNGAFVVIVPKKKVGRDLTSNSKKGDSFPPPQKTANRKKVAEEEIEKERKIKERNSVRIFDEIIAKKEEEKKKRSLKQSTFESNNQPNIEEPEVIWDKLPAVEMNQDYEGFKKIDKSESKNKTLRNQLNELGLEPKKNITHKLTDKEKQEIIELSNRKEFTDPIEFTLGDFTKPEKELKEAPKVVTNFGELASGKKLAFINRLLQLSNKKNVDEKTRQKLVGLIGTELEKTGMVEDEVLRKIIADVDNLKSAMNYLDKGAIKNEPGKSDFQSKKPPHKPRSTVNFLSNFKVDNDTGLKELVHRPNSKTLDTHELLEKIKNHPVLSYDFGNGYIQGFEPINNWVRQETIKLIKQFEKVLVENKANKYFHPFRVDNEYTEQAKRFKRNYRFGPAGDDNYSCLRILIRNIASSCVKDFNYTLVFEPEENMFDYMTTFFSWKPALEDGLMYIFNNLNDSSNIKGKDFKKTKKIKIRSAKDREREMIDVFIEDVDSIANKDEKEILKVLRKSDPITKNSFRGLCNWSVLLDNPNGSFELRILSDRVSEYKDEPIVKLEEKNNAFVHKLSFYNL